MYELKVKSRFAAAHRLDMVGAKCENLHGHNWNIEVHLGGARLDGAGVLVDFGIVKKHLAAILERLDHQFLNELEPFAQKPPSSENIAKHIADGLAGTLRVPGVRVTRVTAWESEDACATYIPDAP